MLAKSARKPAVAKSEEPKKKKKGADPVLVTEATRLVLPRVLARLRTDAGVNPQDDEPVRREWARRGGPYAR